MDGHASAPTAQLAQARAAYDDGRWEDAIAAFAAVKMELNLQEYALRQTCLLYTARARGKLEAWQEVVDASTVVVVLGDRECLRDGYLEALELRAGAYEALQNPMAAEADYRNLAAAVGGDAGGPYLAAADRLKLQMEVECDSDAGILQPEKVFVGCKHYGRRCRKYCPTCTRLVDCRLCHDERYDHKLPRSEVVRIQCGTCLTDQPASNRCTNSDCGISFSAYYCDICKFWSDIPDGEAADFIWHCDKCGLCRKARKGQSRADYTHCAECGMCWPLTDTGHKCRSSANTTCPCCMENLHTSTSTVSRLDCGHFLHCNCKVALLRSGRFACPLCKKTFARELFHAIRAEVEMNRMPPELAIPVQVLCNDCLEKSTVRLHYVAMECPRCNGFNTTQIEGPSISPAYLMPRPDEADADADADAPSDNDTGVSD